MSTNLNCLFVQKSTDAWFYVLESPFNSKCAWDWRETAQAYGPFPTEEAADEHLRDNHANPGGAEIEALPEGVAEIDLSKDETLKRLFDEAESPRRQGHGFRFR